MVMLRNLHPNLGKCSYVGECSGDPVYQVRYDAVRDGGGSVFPACTLAARWIEQRIREDGADNIRTLTRIEE